MSAGIHEAARASPEPASFATLSEVSSNHFAVTSPRFFNCPWSPRLRWTPPGLMGPFRSSPYLWGVGNRAENCLLACDPPTHRPHRPTDPPTHRPTDPPTHRPTDPPSCRAAELPSYDQPSWVYLPCLVAACLPTSLPQHLPICLLTYLPTYLPISPLLPTCPTDRLAQPRTCLSTCPTRWLHGVTSSCRICFLQSMLLGRSVRHELICASA